MRKIGAWLLAGCCVGAWAQTNPPTLDRLAQDPTWLGLLQIHGGEKSGDPSFYWGEPSDSPIKELTSSIEAAHNPETRMAFACRFPARFFYLSHHLGWHEAKSTLKACPKLQTSINMDGLDGISLILVGSYLSNPASSFGHTLLRLDQRSVEGEDRSLSFNYGALIPPRENVAKYIAKGIFGGYTAAYSDQDPLVHDVTYNHLENRDSWVYELKHTEDDRLLIALHLWEMAGAKFQYFFFSRNCAWQMANSLRLSLQPQADRGVSDALWILPVDAVHELQSKGQIKKVTHLPSHQRQLSQALQMLQPGEVIRFKTLIDSDQAPDPAMDSPAVVNALIDYYTWRNASNSIEAAEGRHWIEMREAAVLARLQQPPDQNRLQVPPQASPAEGNKPIKLDLGYVDRPVLSWSVYAQGPLDPHTLGVGHIRALVWDWSIEADQLKLDAFTFLDIQRLNAQDTWGLIGVTPSWRVLMDAKRDEHDHLQARGRGSLGWSFQQGPITTSLFADLHWQPGGARVEPSLNVMYRRGRLQSNIEAEGSGHRSMAVQYQWSDPYFLGFEYDKQATERAGFRIGRYW